MVESGTGPAIAISPQFNVHVIDEKSIVLLSEERSFRLTGQLYVALAPLMDGSRSFEDIVATMAEADVPEERVRFALNNMLEKGYARYFAAGVAKERQAFWVEWEFDPIEAEAALSAGKVGVIAVGAQAGTDRAGADKVTAALTEIGIEVVASADAELCLVIVDDYLDPALADINSEMRAAGTAWLPFKPGGRTPWLGPVFKPDGPGCWRCLFKRLYENRPGDNIAARRARVVRPARGWLETGLAIAQGLAALEVARYLVSKGDGDLSGGLLSFDTKSRVFRLHKLHPQRHCPECGEVSDPESLLRAAMAPIAIDPQPFHEHADGGWRTSAPAEALRRLEAHVSPITGIVSGIEELSDSPSMPVYSARQMTPSRITPRQNRRIGRPGGAAGKGMSHAQAKVSCLAEAVERYCCGWTGSEARRRERLSTLGADALHPHRLLNYSDSQYDDRDKWNSGESGFNWVGERFDEDRAIDWTPAWSLSETRTRWLPTRYCYFDYTDDQAEGGSQNEFCYPDSNGCASGSTLEEAIVQGFLELVERDACAIWWYNRLERPGLDLDSADDPFVRRAVDYYRDKGRSLDVIDITHDFAIPVFVAVSHVEDGGRIVLGLGAHFDAGIALSRAISEMNQTVALDRHLIDSANQGETKDGFTKWLLEETIETQPYMVARSAELTALQDFAAPPWRRFDEAIGHCLDVVRDHGMELVVLDHSRPEIDFACARVVVPGMRHFWARLAPGRLYDLPVELGWLDAPLTEQQMNPIPFFL